MALSLQVVRPGWPPTQSSCKPPFTGLTDSCLAHSPSLTILKSLAVPRTPGNIIFPDPPSFISRDFPSLPPPADMLLGRKGNDQHSLPGEPCNWPKLEHLMGNLRGLLFHSSDFGDLLLDITSKKQGIHRTGTSPAGRVFRSILIFISPSQTEGHRKRC